MSKDKSTRLEVDVDIVKDTMRRYAESGHGATDATVDDLVRVKMGNSMNVLSVEILSESLNPALKLAIEAAAMGAFNTAMRKSAQAAGAAMQDIRDQMRERAKFRSF